MNATHRLIELPERRDSRGALTFAQGADQIPFPVKRFFMLYGVTPDASRGGHAHRQQHQLLIMASGAVLVTIDNGANRNSLRLDRPNLALHVPPMLWLDLRDFSPDSTCMVLTSDEYDEADYIRDHTHFLRLTGPR